MDEMLPPPRRKSPVSDELLRLEHDIYNVLATQTIANVERARESFGRILSETFVRRYVNDHLTGMIEDSRYSPNLAAERTILVCSNDRFEMFMTFLPMIETTNGGPRFISSLSNHHMIGCIVGGPLKIAMFKEVRGDSEVFDASAACQRVESVVLGAGDARSFERDIDMFSVEQSSSEAVLLRLTTRETSRLRWDYDFRTLFPKRIVAANLEDSRAQFATQVLSHIGDARSVDVLRNLYDHPAHFVRWSAIQAIGALDKESALALLARAIKDTHVEIREAAAIALETVRR